jgi:hypothetical protein
MSFKVTLEEKDFAFLVGKMTLNTPQLFFRTGGDIPDGDLEMQLCVRFTPAKIGPGNFETDKEFGVFKIDLDMFASGKPFLNHELDNGKLHITCTGFNMITAGEKKEHFAARRLVDQKDQRTEYQS